MALFTGAALGVGAVGGQNLVVLVGAVLVALWGVEVVLGAWNLRGLEVARRLPAEIFAGMEGRGALRVTHRKRGGAAVGLVLAEEGHPETAGVAATVPPGGDAEVPVGWRFPARGPTHLRAVRLSSAWPFGWVVRERRVALPAEVVVWPRPRPGRREVEAEAVGTDREAGGRPGPWGDFAGLRAYRPGDRPRSIHWPTTARVGSTQVVVRHDGAGEVVRVRVPDRRGRAWEDALSAACGEVVRGFRAGHDVGLVLPERTLEPRPGAAWRRVLLDTLGRAARRDP